MTAQNSFYYFATCLDSEALVFRALELQDSITAHRSPIAGFRRSAIMNFMPTNYWRFSDFKGPRLA